MVRLSRKGSNPGREMVPQAAAQTWRRVMGNKRESESSHIPVNENEATLLGGGGQSMALADPSCPQRFMEEAALFPPHLERRHILKG